MQTFTVRYLCFRMGGYYDSGARDRDSSYWGKELTELNKV